LGITTILWDLDGVIADTAKAHFLAWSTFAYHHHIPYSKALFQKTFGMNNRSILKLLFQQGLPDFNFKELAQEKETLFQSLLKEHISLFPCAADLMTLFQSNGLRQIIASSAPAQNIQWIISFLKIDHLVPDFVSGDHLLGKPHPVIFQRAAEFLKVSNKECIVIEDSPLGIQAARAAMMCSIGVASTFDTCALSNADDVVPNLCALKERIHNRGFSNYFSKITLNHPKKVTTTLPI
jgi:beta-phosphoglucomutase